jgi:hypothetical protein
LKREITEEVHKEVELRLTSEGATNEEANRKSRNKLKKRLRKQRGKFTPSIKNRIRSIERTLSRRGDRIPEEAAAKMRQHIEQLHAEYAAGQLAERERKMSVRYRKVNSHQRSARIHLFPSARLPFSSRPPSPSQQVKFFERQKLQRELRKLTRQLEAARGGAAIAANATADMADAAAAVDGAEADPAQSAAVAELEQRIADTKRDLEYVSDPPNQPLYPSEPTFIVENGDCVYLNRCDIVLH